MKPSLKLVTLSLVVLLLSACNTLIGTPSLENPFNLDEAIVPLSVTRIVSTSVEETDLASTITPQGVTELTGQVSVQVNNLNRPALTPARLSETFGFSDMTLHRPAPEGSAIGITPIELPDTISVTSASMTLRVVDGDDSESDTFNTTFPQPIVYNKGTCNDDGICAYIPANPGSLASVFAVTFTGPKLTNLLRILTTGGVNTVTASFVLTVDSDPTLVLADKMGLRLQTSNGRLGF